MRSHPESDAGHTGIGVGNGGEANGLAFLNGIEGA